MLDPLGPYCDNVTDYRLSYYLILTPVCNYAKGKWVVDDRRPLYSGFGCKQWLAPMWACSLMQRQDFAFEKLRWQPKGCEMEEFEGPKFLKRMQDKTLAFVGDSLGRQQFQSLMCMITDGKDRSDVLDVGNEYGLVLPPGSIRPNGWAYRFISTNTTVLYYWSSGLCELEPLDVPKHPHLKAFYRSISPRHFVNGDWNTGGSCNNTKPMSIGKEVLQEGSSDHAAVSAVRWTGVKLLDITALSQVRDEGHISRICITSSPRVQDCLHWCLPGVPDTWNEVLFAQI
ncbi:hypothetical protein Goshw_011635 [Gossypium schwendimanii]|uniref:Trichome birefringence-like N-terminal domain-containing protein n=1 Tax=Gossypium schwendimanii TaxID=34291 RepID=A0A7J9MBI7_GOSSC|nr:hypothetical protein [Gossypium schwendimanii]